MWRWSPVVPQVLTQFIVFSTYVEVIPTSTPSIEAASSILHVCGGDPKPIVDFDPTLSYSPRMWRWSQKMAMYKRHPTVFSTYVEVILSLLLYTTTYMGILHVCGGDPFKIIFISKWIEYSPRMWRWSKGISVFEDQYGVFSTYVEVIHISCVHF